MAATNQNLPESFHKISASIDSWLKVLKSEIRIIFDKRVQWFSQRFLIEDKSDSIQKQRNWYFSETLYDFDSF